MKVGDSIGLGANGTVSLWVAVEEFDGSDIVFWVINGAWKGILHPNSTMTVFSPFGARVVENVTVQFDAPVPQHVKDHGYNAVIKYMDEQLASPWVCRITSEVLLRLKLRVNRIGRAAVAAREAFVKSWRGHASNPKFVDMDDDIPF